MDPSPQPNQSGAASPHIQYQNPIPVAVAIVPVYAMNPATGQRQLGLLAIERGIPPQEGSLALPGGYLEYEDWRAGLLRELHEETGVRLDDAQMVTLQGAYSIDSNRKIVLFGSVPPIDESQLANFVSNSECPRFQILFEAQELAFQTHSLMARRFFESVRDESCGWLNAPALPAGFRGDIR